MYVFRSDMQRSVLHFAPVNKGSRVQRAILSHADRGTTRQHGDQRNKMMIVRIEHAVPDFEKWKKAFDSDPADRRGAGVRRYQVLRSDDNPNFVMIDLEFDEQRQAEAFLDVIQRIWTSGGKAVMQNPVARIAELVERKEL